MTKLERLRNVEVELETERVDSRLSKELLAKERELTQSLLEQNKDLVERLQCVSNSLDAEKARLNGLLETQRSEIDQTCEKSTNRVAALENQLNISQEAMESIKEELTRLTDQIQVLEVENKSLKASIVTKQADYSLQIDRLNREISELTTSKNKTISDQRLLIDQLSNSMSDAATQLMETQNLTKFHGCDMEAREKKISILRDRIAGLEQIVSDKDLAIKEAKEETAEASKQLHRVHREIEVLASDLESAKSALAQKESTVSQLERHKARTDLIQSNLVSELESLPVINKRLESDCAFLRDELKNCAQKITMISKENDFLSSKLKIVDSILSPEQRLRVNDKTGQPIPSKSEASAVSENKKLQIEAMELRMRLVDSQAARDRAQSQLIDQSQMIARLQKQLSISPTHQLQENVSPSDPSPIAQVAEVKRFKKSVDDRRLSAGVEQECKQQ